MAKHTFRKLPPDDPISTGRFVTFSPKAPLAPEQPASAHAAPLKLRPEAQKVSTKEKKTRVRVATEPKRS
jgi:hypothetical protein